MIIFGQRQTICQNDAETHTGYDASSRTSAIIMLHHTLSHWWLGRVVPRRGLAGPDSDDSPQQGQSSAAGGCVCCLLPPDSPSVVSSQMCHSINDWCPPSGLDSSFTCSLPHSCSLSLSAGLACVSVQLPPTRYELLRGWCGFRKSPKANVSNASVCTWTISPSWAYSSACLLLFHRLGGDRGSDGSVQMLLCLVSAFCIFVLESVGAIIQYVSHPFIVIPRSKGIKKSHFSAAEAVIPCCQSPLCCGGCICSSPELSIEEAPQQAQWCRFINEQHGFFATHESMFSQSQRWGQTGWMCLCSYGSPTLMLMLSSTTPTVTYLCKYDEQVIFFSSWLSHGIVCVWPRFFVCFESSL